MANPVLSFSEEIMSNYNNFPTTIQQPSTKLISDLVRNVHS